MARPREFDADAALESAMRVFWEKGYDASSMSDLLAAMGIAKGSLYKAFKDKRSVYLASLERYERTMVEPVLAMLRDKSQGEGLARVRRLLELAAQPAAANDRGCFLCNAAVDQAQADAQVRAKVLAMTRRIERAIAEALAESAADHAEAARRLTALYMGLRVLARAGYPPTELEAVISSALRL